jgi:hypothetical protein
MGYLPWDERGGQGQIAIQECVTLEETVDPPMNRGANDAPRERG